MTHILVIGKTLNNPAMVQAAGEAGVRVSFLTSVQSHSLPDDFDAWDYDALLAGLDHGDHASLLGSRLLEKKSLIVPVSAENITADITTLPPEAVERLNAYFVYAGLENWKNGLRMISLLTELYASENDEAENDPTAADNLRRQLASIPDPRPTLMDAIYTFDGAQYADVEDFFAGEGRLYEYYVGIFSYRGRFTDGDLEIEKAIAESLNRRGIGVITAYSEGTPDAEMGTLSFEDAVHQFFCQNGRPVIDLLINFQFLGTKGDKVRTMFETAADFFAGLNLPVVRPAVVDTDEETWKREKRPYSRVLAFNFVIPEMQGVIETVHIGYTDRKNVRHPDLERIERLTGRIAAWLELRHQENSEKKIVIMLHNAPCQGAEANIGQATDLDAFASAVSIMRRLRDEGYQAENLPTDGNALREMIFAHKAFSDFRWTSAEDILEGGGVLLAMEKETYHTFYDRLTPTVRESMEKTWGPAPGAAMVVDGKMLVTGLSFGNVLLMVQPKRGCYGAKCSGEVCRVLQDPNCPPTHQYLATYWYIQHIWQANAVIHLGTHGSLEYLPGKDCGLGSESFSDIAIGDLPNLYPYCSSIIGQALVAKRRSYAVTLSHLPAPGKGLSVLQRKLSGLIRRYFEARETENGQAELLKDEIRTLAVQSEAAMRVLEREDDFDAAMRELRGMFMQTAESRRMADRHVFGEEPDRRWVTDYIAEEWLSDREIAGLWDDIEDPVQKQEMICRLIEEALGESDSESKCTENGAAKAVAPDESTLHLPEEICQFLKQDARLLAEGLSRAGNEMDNLLNALSGGYVRPSRGGEAGSGGRAILPTGRNLYGVETDRVPTATAYARGKQAAEELIALYRQDEGRMPGKVAMNMTSLDITRTGGEQLGQFMGLLGVRPIWNDNGVVEGLQAISLEELGRPRVDVTAKISSVMRDAWPDVLVLMDRAVQLAAGLPESDEDNPIRANSRKISESSAAGEYAGGRIFGNQPGTYSSAIGLALKASAWKGEEDLAKYFIDAYSYLYGEKKEGVRAVKAFEANVRQIDLTSDLTASRRTDAAASSYGARVQGGFRLAAKSLGNKKTIRQYTGESGSGRTVRVVSLAAHVEKAIQDTLLNDVWMEQTKASGYQGGAEMMEHLRNIFETQCVSESVADKTLDKLAERYLTDEKMREWFAENNPYALEESGRRFLEMQRRGKWDADKDILQKLQRAYLQAEGDMEDGVTGNGDIQGGNVDICSFADVKKGDIV